MDRPDKPRKESLLLAAQHQLRQPLNALSLLIGELRHVAGGKELESIAEDMRTAVRLQNAWLDALAELEAAALGAIETDPRPVALQAIVAGLAAEMGPRFSALGLDLRIVATRAVAEVDAALLRRVLVLLLDNAAKFTPAGKVVLGCRHVGGDLRVELWDSGPGMTPEEAAQAFEPFFRLDNEVRPRERGLGLGLATARRLAALAGGELAVAVRPGRGCCFRLTLRPAGRGDEAAPAPEPAAGDPPDPLAGTEVPLLRGPFADALSGQLAAWGVRVRAVAPGELAAVLAAAPRLLVADREAFAAAGPLSPCAATVIVLVGENLPGRADPPGVHSLGLPLRPARLRALCHYALTRDANPASLGGEDQ
ncbi:MAG: sensor histidine kinase [Bacteroidota bacterium]|nr:HAMP domain-containing sensor histidine kinase [Kiloniellaceae bacterium]